uniref:Uncharacterized protein n=1 Tax=Candidatus Kentrum sp. TC TaxID=2126339 RepID=A0A450ZUP6_9GAMM|nr:MAG: hypothetical protein BECKTC1821F_GA0114240_101810 [Candidatus Kentron sp. TC]
MIQAIFKNPTFLVLAMPGWAKTTFIVRGVGSYMIVRTRFVSDSLFQQPDYCLSENNE